MNSGKHPFVSVILDSLTEIQARVKDSVSGRNTPSERDWGIVLIEMQGIIRKFRDLTMNPKNPLKAVVFLALTMDKGGKWRPSLQGQISVLLPQYVSLVGYMYADRPGEGEEEFAKDGVVRRLLVTPLDNYVAKDRTHFISQKYGKTIINPNITDMIETLTEGVQNG